MSKKYYGRSPSIISRDPESIDIGDREPSWFKDYASNLEKESAKSKKNDYSLFDQINNILGNKSKYSSVEEAVLDMQRRTGLLDLLSQKKQAQLATINKHKNNKTLTEIPSIKTFVDNYIEDHPGTSVDAAVHALLDQKSIKDQLACDDAPDDVKEYINDKLLEMKKLNPKSKEDDLNLGKLDFSTNDDTSKDNDPFASCMPAKDSK
jgi:hypothetical protein